MRTGPVVTEVRMGQGSLGGDPSLRIKQQHFLKREKNKLFLCFFFVLSFAHLQQVQRQRVNLRDELFDVPGLLVDEVVPQHGRVLRPGRGWWSPEELEDLGELVSLVLPGEQRGLAVELGEDAAAAPDVHRGGVGGPQQDLGCSVPQGHHLTPEKKISIKNI